MCAKLSELGAFAERMGATRIDKDSKMVAVSEGEILFTSFFTSEERAFLLRQVDEEIKRNKAVLKGKCSKDVRPKTREKFEKQWWFLQDLRAKLC